MRRWASQMAIRRTYCIDQRSLRALQLRTTTERDAAGIGRPPEKLERVSWQVIRLLDRRIWGQWHKAQALFDFPSVACIREARSPTNRDHRCGSKNRERMAVGRRGEGQLTPKGISGGRSDWRVAVRSEVDKVEFWLFVSKGKLMHRFPEDGPFERRMQIAELDYIASSTAAHTAIAENYVGFPI